ncbi:MAG: phospholipase D family protein [Bacteriovorax sp.]|jgi:putative cardiolipin synthase
MAPKFVFILAILFSTLFSSAAFAEDEESVDKEPYRKTSTEPHDMRIVNSGSAALYARIDMIRRATKSIELETFIFNKDSSGKIVMKELLEAAKRGVKVRILVDKAFNNIKLDEYDAQQLKQNGVELRFYNNASLLNVSTVQYRNHRKLLIVDDKEVITGGRNIADEYFDLSKRFNFLDRDATIEGEIAATIRESFDKFWDSGMTETPAPVEKPTPPLPSDEEGGRQKYEADMYYYKKYTERAKKLGELNADDERKLKFIMEAGKESFLQNERRMCPEVSFASDKEGAGFLESFSDKYRKRFRHLRSEISKWMKKKVKTEITIDTPYFLDNDLTEYLENGLAEKVKVNVMTNSLASTDAIHVSSVFNDTVNRFTQSEYFKAYTYKGKFSEEGKVLDDEIKNSTWGTHSKTMVFNDDSFMVGTFNMDNRSTQYNAELAVFCSGSKELTEDIQKNIKLRMSGSNRLNNEGLPDDCSDPFKDVGQLKKALYYLIKIPSHFLQFLL